MTLNSTPVKKFNSWPLIWASLASSEQASSLASWQSHDTHLAGLSVPPTDLLQTPPVINTTRHQVFVRSTAPIYNKSDGTWMQHETTSSQTSRLLTEQQNLNSRIFVVILCQSCRSTTFSHFKQSTLHLQSQTLPVTCFRHQPTHTHAHTHTG